jgi:hypothetical protein
MTRFRASSGLIAFGAAPADCANARGADMPLDSAAAPAAIILRRDRRIGRLQRSHMVLLLDIQGTKLLQMSKGRYR